MVEELAARAVLVAVLVAMGVLLLWLARAAADGRLPRNFYVGIRISSTLASDAAWLAGHRAAEAPTRWAGWVSIVSAVPALLPVADGWWVGAGLAGCGVLLVLVVYAAVLAGRAARGLDDADDSVPTT